MTTAITAQVRLQEALTENQFLRNRLLAMAQVAEDLMAENNALKRGAQSDSIEEADTQPVE